MSKEEIRKQILPDWFTGEDKDFIEDCFNYFCDEVNKGFYPATNDAFCDYVNDNISAHYTNQYQLSCNAF